MELLNDVPSHQPYMPYNMSMKLKYDNSEILVD